MRVIIRRYDDFCMDTEGTYCAIVANPEYLTQWQGPNATYTMHLEVPCDTGARALLVRKCCLRETD